MSPISVSVYEVILTIHFIGHVLFSLVIIGKAWRSKQSSLVAPLLFAWLGVIVPFLWLLLALHLSWRNAPKRKTSNASA